MTQGAVTWVEAASGFSPPGWGRENLSQARTRQARGYKALELYVGLLPGKSRRGLGGDRLRGGEEVGLGPMHSSGRSQYVMGSLPCSSLLTTHEISHPGESEAAKVTGRILPQPRAAASRHLLHLGTPAGLGPPHIPQGERGQRRGTCRANAEGKEEALSLAQDPDFGGHSLRVTSEPQEIRSSPAPTPPPLHPYLWTSVPSCILLFYNTTQRRKEALCARCWRTRLVPPT